MTGSAQHIGLLAILFLPAAPTVVTAAPARIITIAPNSAEIICELGACAHIVGVSKFCTYPAELASRPKVGGLYDPDLERISALRPDLLVLRGKNDSLEELCRRSNIAVYDDQADSLAGIEKSIQDLGELLERPQRAAEVIVEFRARIEAIRSRTAGRPRPRVFVTLSRQPDRLANILTTGQGTFLAEMIDLAGGENVFAHLEMKYPEVSPESVLAQQPDVIIELMPEIPLSTERQQQLRDQWRQLGPTPAAASNRIFFLTDAHCLIPSPRYHEVVARVSRLLHPQADGK